MNNQLSFQGAVCVCITSYRHNDISVAVTDDQFHSVRRYYSVTVETPLTFLLWLCWGFGCSSLIQAAELGGCVCYRRLRFSFCFFFLIYVV